MPEGLRCHLLYSHEVLATMADGERQRAICSRVQWVRDPDQVNGRRDVLDINHGFRPVNTPIPLWGRPAVVPGTGVGPFCAPFLFTRISHALFTRAFDETSLRDESKRGAAAAAAAVFHERRAALA
jgi:hypothetical protein